MLSTSPQSSKSSQRFLRISAIHHNMTHFISESTVHEYQYSIEHFPETSSLMTSGYGTNYDFSICSRSPHSSLSLKELQTLFPDVPQNHPKYFWKHLGTKGRLPTFKVERLDREFPIRKVPISVNMSGWSNSGIIQRPQRVLLQTS